MNAPESVPALTCARVAALLPLPDDALDASTRAAVRAHLQSCAACRAQRDQYAQLDTTLRQRYGLSLVQPRSTEEIMRFIATRHSTADAPAGSQLSQPPRRPPMARRSVLSGLGAFAAVLLLVALSLAVFSGRLGIGPGAYHFDGPPRYSFPGVQGLFADMSMVSPDEGWALAQVTKTPQGEQPLNEVTLYHYLNGTWTPVTVKTRESFATGGVSGFNGTISMDSPSDGWAVAHNFNQLTVLLHYAHGTWSEVPVANDLYLDHVQALSPHSVWAIEGQYDNVSLVHFDGTTWSDQAMTGLPAGSQQREVDYHMLSDTEGWALVGTTTSSNSDTTAYAVERDNGGHWTLQSTFSAGAYANFDSLAMVSPTEGWALGQKIVADSHGVTTHVPLKQLIYHYVNGHWSEAPLTLSGLPYISLAKIVMLSPTDGWIVGAEQASYPGATVSAYQQHTVMLHYSGGAWTQVQLPQANTPVDAITGLAFTSDGHAWACGYVSNLSASQVVQDTDILAQASPMLWTLRGTAWSIVQP